jgi:hypothetical protein
LFSYDLNNPLRYIDPDGSETIAISYPFYQVDVYRGINLPLGHAGVAIVGRDGQVSYFEYGRYNPAGAGGDVAQGVLRAGPVGFKPPSVTRDASGRITPESMKALLAALSNAAGKRGAVTASVIDTTEDQDGEMLKYLSDRLAENNDPNRTHYNPLRGPNCGTLICDVLQAAKLPALTDTSLRTPSDVFGFIRSIFDSQTFLYEPKGSATSRFCFQNDQGKWECQN